MSNPQITEEYDAQWGQWRIASGSRIVISTLDDGHRFHSRLYVNKGETATTTAAEHSTREGVRRWATKVLVRS